jgi:hypothetical protein
MAHNFQFAARLARLRGLYLAALAFALPACSPDSLTPDTTDVSAEDTPLEVSALDEPALSSGRFSGGIPFGTTGHPNAGFGSQFNGAQRIISPNLLLKDLAAIKARGGRIVLNMAGGQRRFTDRRGHFDFARWKSQIDRFKKIKFASYISDGTIIAHYLIDEPHDRTNWRGTIVSAAMIDQMAKYSKQLWPKMATVVRAEPRQIRTGYRYRYLDAAWAQYVARKGTARDFIRRNVADAQSMGLGLVVGLNFQKGGLRGRRLTAEQIRSWGSALLESSYPCAFISWHYNAGYLRSGSVSTALQTLRRQAQNRGTRSCAVGGRGGGGRGDGDDDDD